VGKTEPRGTGPFKFDSFTRGDVLKYVKTEDYWQEGKPYLDGVYYHFITDTMTQQAAMQTEGEEGIDVLNTSSGEQIATLTAMGLEATYLPIGPLVLVPNSAVSDSPLSDLKVRQAIYHASTERASSRARIRRLDVRIPVCAVRLGAHIDELDVDPYDPALARSLTEAGYPNGFSTNIICMPNFADKDAMVAIQNQLDAVGITVELQFPDSGGYLNQRKSTWDGMLAQHMRALSNINTTYRIYIDPSIGDLPDMMRSDEILAAVQASFSGHGRRALTKAVNQLMYET
jgi:peptide/nickel transport system substrate-binding protein